MVGKLIQSKPNSNGIKSNPSSPDRQFSLSNLESGIHGDFPRNSKWWQLSYIPIFAILVLLFLIILLPLLDQVDLRIQYLLNKELAANEDECIFEIVETIPEGMVYPSNTPKHSSTFETWKKLINIAEHSIEIGSFYWSLRKWNQFPNESQKGDEIFNDLLNAGANRGITIKIAENKNSKNFYSNETLYLMMKGGAKVKFLDFDALLGSGILHSKFWIVDRKHLYLGSANLDWRAVNQVKELGVAFYNCSSVAEDLAKIFDTYWTVGNQTVLPRKWGNHLWTTYNSKNPFKLQLNGQNSSFYISSSPPSISPPGRNDDLLALLSTIQQAKKFVHVSVMEYLPLLLGKGLRYWPFIDNELRKAVVERKVQVRLLLSLANNTKPMSYNFLRSLLSLNKFKKYAVLEIKWFQVPSDDVQKKIPYARLSHTKYMVTDNGAYISTSNWSGDYFNWTAGVSLVSPSLAQTPNIIQTQLKAIFDRDWNSTFATPLTLQ